MRLGLERDDECLALVDVPGQYAYEDTTQGERLALRQMQALDAQREQFNAQGVELMQSTPAALSVYVKNELARWSKLLKEMGINEAP